MTNVFQIYTVSRDGAVFTWKTKTEDIESEEDEEDDEPIASTSAEEDRDDQDEVLVKAMFALYRSFVLVSQKGVLGNPRRDSVRDGEVEEEEEKGRKMVKSWVLARLDVFTELLAGLLQDENKTIRVRALYSNKRRGSPYFSNLPCVSSSHCCANSLMRYTQTRIQQVYISTCRTFRRLCEQYCFAHSQPKRGHDNEKHSKRM